MMETPFMTVGRIMVTRAGARKTLCVDGRAFVEDQRASLYSSSRASTSLIGFSVQERVT